MMGVFSNNTLDGIDKGLGLIQALMKEDLEFFLADGDVNLIFHLVLVFLPAKQGGILGKSGGKWHPILTLGPGSSKMVLILLEKVIAFWMSFYSI